MVFSSSRRSSSVSLPGSASCAIIGWARPPKKLRISSSSLCLVTSRATIGSKMWALLIFRTRRKALFPSSRYIVVWIVVYAGRGSGRRGIRLSLRSRMESPWGGFRPARISACGAGQVGDLPHGGSGGQSLRSLQKGACYSGDWIRRDGRVAEGARLESVYRGNSIQGSNPCLSARPHFPPRLLSRIRLVAPFWTRSQTKETENFIGHFFLAK